MIRIPIRKTPIFWFIWLSNMDDDGYDGNQLEPEPRAAAPAEVG